MKGKGGFFASIRELLGKNTGTEEIERILWKKFGEECAVVVVDSAGFTRITQKHGIVHFLAGLLKAEKFVRETFKSNGCLAFRLEADNMYAEFPTTDQAVEAAILANKILAKEKIHLTEGEDFRICAGIGFGKVLRSAKHGVYGDEMNLASKLGEDIANGEEILLTAAAFSSLKKKDGLRFDRWFMDVSGVSAPYYQVIY